VFNFNYTNTSSGHWRGGNYSTTGALTTQGQAYWLVDVNYKGDWMVLKFPSAQVITQLKIYQRADVPTRAPASFRVYASNNSTTWTQLLNVSGLTQTNYPSNIYTGNITNSTAYLYYCITVNSILGGTSGDGLNFNEIVFLNNEQITSATTSLSGGSGGGGGGGGGSRNTL